jgi:sialidase-1
MVGAVLMTSSIATNSGSTYYRIPAVCLAGNRLVVSFDQRNGSAADLPNAINVLTSQSTDGGATWSTPTTVVSYTGDGTQAGSAGVGDSSLVYNPDIQRLYCFYLYAPVGVGLSNSSNSTVNGSTTTVAPQYAYSDDLGVTWHVRGTLIGAFKTSSMYGIFSAGGHQWYSGGKVYTSIAYSKASGSGTYYGKVWSASDASPTGGVALDSWTGSPEFPSPVNEHHTIVRSDGSLLSNARPNTAGSRILSTASSIGGTWTSNSVATLPDPSCNGDVIVADPTGRYCPTTWLLASGCASTSLRANLSVWLSKDNGVTWDRAQTIYPGGAAYSTMTSLNNGSFVIVWENTDSASIQCSTFNLDQFAL